MRRIGIWAGVGAMPVRQAGVEGAVCLATLAPAVAAVFRCALR